MHISIVFKKITPSTPLKSYVHKKLDRLDKMLDGAAEAHVVLTVEKIRHIAEITLDSNKIRIHAKEESETMYSAIDALADKVKLQIKKHKEKLRRHLAGDRQSIKTDFPGYEYPGRAMETPMGR